jgi:hypothetical protein
MEDENFKDSVKSYFGNDILFREDKIGRLIFYPSGALGNGYCLPDNSKQEDIKNFLMLISGIWMVVISICIFIGQEKPMAILFLLLFFLLSGLWYRIKIRKLLSGFEVIKIGSEFYSPPTFDKRYRGLFIVILLGGVFGGVGNIYNKGFSINDLLLAMVSATFLVLYSYIAWIRK